MPQRDPFSSVRGPVRRVEVRQEADGYRTVTEYDRDGRITLWENHPSSGHMNRTSTVYDASGRITYTESEYGEGKRTVSRHIYDGGKLVRIEWQEFGGGVTQITPVEQKPDGGRVHVTSLTNLPTERDGVKIQYDITVAMHGAATRREEYDSADRKTLTSFLDSDGKLLSTIQYLYDEAGRLIEEHQTFGETNPIVEGLRANAPAEVVNVIATVMGLGEGRRVTYRYDQDGREVEQHRLFPPIEDTTVYSEYNERGDISRHSIESVRRGFSGTTKELKETVEPSTRSGSEFEYDHDARGNWIRRVTRSYGQSIEGQAHEATSTRVIEYYD